MGVRGFFSLVSRVRREFLFGEGGDSGIVVGGEGGGRGRGSFFSGLRVEVSFAGGSSVRVSGIERRFSSRLSVCSILMASGSRGGRGVVLVI